MRALTGGLVVALLSALGTAPADAVVLSGRVATPEGKPIEDAVVFVQDAGPVVDAANRAATLDQVDKTFVPGLLPIVVGTRVNFPNHDQIQHHVYSFSPAKKFELPLYKGTPANPIVFSAAGVVTLGCNIHDKMNGYIVVLDTPYFEKTEAAGRVEFRNLPPGKYTVHAWQPDMLEEPAAQELTIGEGEHTTLAFTVKPAPAAMVSAPLNKVEDKFKKYGGNGRP